MNLDLLFIWDLISNHTFFNFSLFDCHLRLIKIIFLSIISRPLHFVIVINIYLIVKVILVQIVQIFGIFFHLFRYHWICWLILLFLREIIKFYLHVISLVLIKISSFSFLCFWNNIILFITFLFLSSYLVISLITVLRSI